MVTYTYLLCIEFSRFLVIIMCVDRHLYRYLIITNLTSVLGKLTSVFQILAPFLFFDRGRHRENMEH